ncbi:serine hydrolase [Microbacterium sp. No. 7]|uniref:serine hydrolase n=1 Tax=Microbacterium sp. No. 7 TaxID=1714373 RepID=UPI0006D1997E|nr:serine hydrolase [Microbacterium sp. No. 7]ALJ21802.1 serine hydrolase [Microbacterium sp. No. 7]
MTSRSTRRSRSGRAAPPSVGATRRAAPPGGRAERRRAAERSTFDDTMRALDGLACAGALVSLRVIDLDRGTEVVAGDDHVVMPIGGLGTVAVLIETAAALDEGRLDAEELIDRSTIEPVSVGGVWHRLAAPSLSIADLAVLAAAMGDATASNALLDRVGQGAVRERLTSLGMRDLAVLDRFRDARGPDDAPHEALGTTRELADLFRSLLNARVVSPAVSAQVAEWLSLGQDLSLVAAATGLDPAAHDDDRYQLLFVNKTGRADGVRAEAGALGGPRASVAYALAVCFDDLSIVHRVRVHDAFHTLGVDLMEFVH